MNRRRALVVAAIAAATVGLGLPAWAFFTASSTTVTPSVSAGSVNSPGIVSVTSINSTASLSWSAPTSPSGASFTYTVSRTGGAGESLGAGCTGSLSTTSCTDAGVVPGTSYTWTVTPHLGNNWNGSTSQASGTAAGALNKFAVTLPTSSTAGDQLNMTVTAQDSGGNTVTGYLGTVAFTSTDSQAVLPANYTFVGSDKGVHTFSNGVTFKTKGNQKATATDGAATGTSSGTVVSAATAKQLVFATSPSGATAGSVFGTQPVVNIDDQYGNITGSNATITLAIGTNPSSGTLSGCSNLTASNGVVTVAGCKINAAGNGYTLTASSAGLDTGTSGAFNVSPAASISVSASATKKSSTNNPTSDTITVTGSNFTPNSSLTATVSAGTITTQMSVTTNSSGNIPSGATFVMNNPTSAQTVTVTVTDGSGKSASTTFNVTSS